MLPFLHPTPISIKYEMKQSSVFLFTVSSALPLWTCQYPPSWTEHCSIPNESLSCKSYLWVVVDWKHWVVAALTKAKGFLLLFLVFSFLKKRSDYLFTICMSGPFYLFICYLLIFTSTPLPAKFQRKETQIIVFFF